MRGSTVHVKHVSYWISNTQTGTLSGLSKVKVPENNECIEYSVTCTIYIKEKHDQIQNKYVKTYHVETFYKVSLKNSSSCSMLLKFS